MAQDSLEEVLDYYNEGNIHYIKVDELIKINAAIIVLDAREKK